MSGSTNHAVSSIFTPTTPARLSFVERETINDKLVNAIRTPGKQIVVYGHSGSGKTTLLVNKLHQLYGRHITSRCMRGMTLQQLVLDAFDQLAPFYIAEAENNSKRSISVELGAEYLGIKDQLKGGWEESQKSCSKRALPAQLTAQALGRFMGAAGVCWVLEDFHKVEDAEKTSVSQMMKVFMDMADEYPNLKIIAIGAVGTARQVVQYDEEMRNRVAEINVPLMTTEEIRCIIDKGEKLLNLRLRNGLKEPIVHYSNGLASVCHHLCLNLCVAAGIFETQDNPMEFAERHLKAALTQYLEEASDTLKFAFDRAFRQKRKGKYDNCKMILRALSQCSQEGATHAEIFEQIGDRKYPAGNLTHYLNQLQTADRGSIVRFDSASHKFGFADPIYRAFCLAYFEKQPTRRGASDFAVIDISAISSIDLSHVLLKEIKFDFADLFLSRSKSPQASPEDKK